jgi:hypothetical protein
MASTHSSPFRAPLSTSVNAFKASLAPASSAAGVAPSAWSSLRTVTWFRSSSYTQTRAPSPTMSCGYGFE